MNRSRVFVFVLLATCLYAVGQLFWYWQTPLGQSPVLDGLENLVTAQRIAEGTLAHEPFYRAMLYPAYLSLFFSLGLSFQAVGILAGGVGVVLHVVVTWLSLRLSWLLWKSWVSVVVTGLLVGMNPVLIHFALDPLDIALATALFLGGVNLLTELDPKRLSVRSRIGAGVLLGLAPLARPHFFAALLVLMLLFIGAGLWKRLERKSVGLLVGGAVVPLFLYAMVQLVWGSVFGVLPWQGAYNLWASNKPAANGLYFEQSIFIHDLGEHRNPTRVESEFLYERETGRKGTIGEQSQYWRKKTLESISDNPGQWLKLMLRKGYALVNNYEQYNNKTYAFHKERSPWLRFNPISWGLLVTLSCIGTFMLFRFRPKMGGAIIFIAFAYAGGILIYMASGRFRVPLIPLGAILAGGLPLVFRTWVSLKMRERTILCVLPLVLGSLSYSNFGDIAVRNTDIQDMMLLADASAKLGRDQEAIDWAKRVQVLDDSREDAIRVELISYYNLVSSGYDDGLGWRSFEDRLDLLTISDPIVDYVKGVAYWNLEEFEKATKAWQQSVAQYGWSASSSLGVLLMTQSEIPIPDLPPQLIEELKGGRHAVLASALAERDVSFASQVGLSREHLEGVRLSVSRALFGPKQGN